jgi:NAD(P)-dependent dehydrogenase (short-subunit alcohol dehydrogenase family)
MRALALELGPRLRVNCFSPGFMDTERFDHMEANDRAAMLESTAQSLPLNRVGQAQDAGQALYFLMSNQFTTGIVLDCDGGHQIRQYATQTNDPFRKKH